MSEENKHVRIKCNEVYLNQPATHPTKNNQKQPKDINNTKKISGIFRYILISLFLRDLVKQQATLFLKESYEKNHSQV